MKNTIVTKVQFNADDDPELYKLINETSKRKRATLVKKMLNEYMQFREVLRSGALKVAFEQTEPDSAPDPDQNADQNAVQNSVTDNATVESFSKPSPIVPFSKLN